MMFRNLLLAGAAVFALSACSSLHRMLTFEGAEAEPEPVPVAAQPVTQPQPAAAGSNEWCQRVAASDRQRAQEAGFDAATLDRMTVQSYQQCVALR